jgi:flagellar hook-length control protein FliK
MTASVLNTLSPVATVSDALGGVNSAPKIAAGEEFSASFLQQIKGLQAQASEAAQPSSVLEKIADSIKGQGGQDFSALLGDSLPQIKQQIQAQDINLDETMTALKEVLAQLDSLSTDNTLPTDTLQDLAAKLEPSTITDTKVVAQGIKNSGDLASKLSSPLTQTNDPSVSAPLSETKVVVNNNQGDLIDDNTLDLAFNLSSSLTQTNEPTVLKNYEPRSSSGIEEAHEQVVQGDIVDVQPETINIIMQQAQLMSETDDQTIAQNVQVTTQLLKQEKSYAQTQLSGEQSTKSKQPEINLNQLLTREKIINNDTDFAPLVSAKGAEKIVDSALLSTSQPVSEQANKFSTTDLIALNRQVESSVTKQELPPMTKSFNQPEWKQEFNERIIWMHKKSIPSAQLRLNPQSLGPISIQINIDKDQQANIVFNAQNAGVREAIEASIPKLREMLNMQQINLAEVNVSQQQQQGQGSARQAMQDAMAENNRNNTGNSMDSTEIEPEVNDIAEEINQGRALSSKGLLSIYA